MCPPGCIQPPMRLCQCSTVPRGPVTMADPVTCTGSASRLNGSASRSSSARNRPREAISRAVAASNAATAPRNSAISRSQLALCRSTGSIMPGPRALTYRRSSRRWLGALTTAARPGRVHLAGLRTAGLRGRLPCQAAAQPAAAVSSWPVRRAPASAQELLRLRSQRAAQSPRRPAAPAGLRRPEPGAGQPGCRPGHPDCRRPAPQGDCHGDWQPRTVVTWRTWSGQCRRHPAPWRPDTPTTSSELGGPPGRAGGMAGCRRGRGAYLLCGWLTRDGRRRLTRKPRRHVGRTVRPRGAGHHWPRHLDRVHGDEHIRAGVGRCRPDLGDRWPRHGHAAASGPGQDATSDSGGRAGRGRSVDGPVPDRAPVLVIALHGVLATATILLVLLAAVGIG